MATKKNNYILGVTGLSQSFHDNSIALFKNGKLIFAASEERFSRQKHDRNFPHLALKYILRKNKISLRQIKQVAVGYPKRLFLWPLLHDPFNFLLTIFYWLVGRHIHTLSDILYILREEVTQNFKSQAPFPKEKITYVDHHLAHAASAAYCSPFKDALAVAIDAFGPDLSGRLYSGGVYRYQNQSLSPALEKIPITSSVGLFYTAVTLALGFTPGDGEGKTMGLAAYGVPRLTASKLRKVFPKFKKGRWHKSPYWVQAFFSNRKSFLPIFNVLPLGKLLNQLVEKYGKEAVAAGAQLVLEEQLLSYFRYLRKKYQASNFALAGGIFLNIKFNQRLREDPSTKGVYVQPNAGDGGTSLGAALVLLSNKTNFKTEVMYSANLGASYSNKQILSAIKKFKGKVEFKKYKDVTKIVAKHLQSGKVIGWFQGGFEWGPRALGYRSVLVDPRRVDVKDRLNNTLKNREWFMPFAPSVMDEHGNDYFVNYTTSPFMTFGFNVKKGKTKDIAAAIHVDKTARPNSVIKKQNPRYHHLINEFRKLTGIGVVLNTSFNKHGLPIVNSPTDALNHLLWDCIEELAIGDYLVTKKGS